MTEQREPAGASGPLPFRWDGKEVLVTGASGFIGSHLTEELVRRGCAVRALVRYNSRNDWGWIETFSEEVRSSIDVMAGDLRDPEAVRRAVRGKSIIFHLGALIAIPYSYLNPREFVDTNIVGTANVLNAAREYGIERLVHTSTSEVYGTARYAPIDEDHPLQGQSPYSASKIGADQLALSYQLSFGLPVAVARPFNTYGPRQSARAVIPTVITQALAGETVRLGSLTPTRDFNYVADTVEGFLSIAAAPRAVGEVINLGSGREVTIGEVARLILQILGSPAEIVADDQRLRPHGSEVWQLIAQARKARELTGWESRVDLRGGLIRTIDWFKTSARGYKASLYNV